MQKNATFVDSLIHLDEFIFQNQNVIQNTELENFINCYLLNVGIIICHIHFFTTRKKRGFRNLKDSLR